jgi:hypothetical protein
LKELHTQITTNWQLKPASPEDLEILRAFQPNQIVKAKITGVKKMRSYLQLKWVMAMITEMVRNLDHPDWQGITNERDQVQAAKDSIKREIKFFKGDPWAEVKGKSTFIFFELRSFAFDKMDQPEADRVFNDVKFACAGRLGCDPEDLEAQAKGVAW